MMHIDPKYLFVLVYLFVDIIYVYLSTSFYQRAVKSIQGHYTTHSFGLAAGVVAYLIMGITWLFFIPPIIKSIQIKYKLPRILAGFITGFMFGLAIYGVFNFTNRAMFDNWNWPIMKRDLAWGISWLTILTSAYAYFST